MKLSLLFTSAAVTSMKLSLLFDDSHDAHDSAPPAP
jgi:hypothetical protein